MILGVIGICLGLGFGFLLIYGVDEVDKVMAECINELYDPELDCLGW